MQPAIPWPIQPATYADANGDGIVNEDDIVPIAGNWLQSRALPAAPSAGVDSGSAVATPEGDVTTMEIYQRMLDALNRHNVVSGGAQALKAWLKGQIRAIRKQYIPDQTRLLPNFPNPFNPETWIPYQLADDARVRIHIYDLKGRHIRTLDLGQKPVGYYVARETAAYWDGRNALGESLASGIYVYQFVAGDYTEMRRLVIVK